MPAAVTTLDPAIVGTEPAVGSNERRDLDGPAWSIVITVSTDSASRRIRSTTAAGSWQRAHHSSFHPATISAVRSGDSAPSYGHG